MVYSKARWKWHECLQVIFLNRDIELAEKKSPARDEITSNDSECDNEDFTDNDCISTHQQGLNDETNETNSSISNDDLFSKQQKLKEQAKVALVLGAKMARMQVEIEREGLEKKRSSFYDIIGVDTNGDRQLTTDLVRKMNMDQLQMMINDLYSRIEENNNQLVNLLIERDSLSMEQDSILVDIEDLSKRLNELEINLPKQSPSNEQTESIYAAKSLAQDVPKKSIFQYFFRKTMFT
ncbi:unnamed protein product [Rotaria socialis]